VRRLQAFAATTQRVPIWPVVPIVERLLTAWVTYLDAIIRVACAPVHGTTLDGDVKSRNGNNRGSRLGRRKYDENAYYLQEVRFVAAGVIATISIQSSAIAQPKITRLTLADCVT
jgi:hypothetical protein